MNVGGYRRVPQRPETEINEVTTELPVTHTNVHPHATEEPTVWQTLINIYSSCYHMYDHMALQYQMLGFDGHKRYWRLTAHYYRQKMLHLQHDGVDYATKILHGPELDYKNFTTFTATNRDECAKALHDSLQEMLEHEKHYHDQIFKELPMYLNGYAQNKIFTIKFINRWIRKGQMCDWDIGTLQIQDKILHDKIKEMEEKANSY
jgi:hypothetical protein